MTIRTRLSVFVSLLLLALFPGSSTAQHTANSNPIYQQLRGMQTVGEAFTVKNLVLKRDAATFTFQDGSFGLYSPINGKTAGAAFKGHGHLHITPPTESERHSLARLMKTEELDVDFEQVVLRFTDATADELRKASAGAEKPDSEYAQMNDVMESFLRRHAEGIFKGESYTSFYKKFYGNLDLRLLVDLLSPAPGQYFMASIDMSKKEPLFFIDDPNGADLVSPEEIALLKWDSYDETESIPLAFHRAAVYSNGAALGNEQNQAYSIINEKLDVEIEKNGALSGIATVTVRADQDGVAVIPLNLYPSLRVSQVQNEKGAPMDWVQEKRDEDPDFGVVLGAPLKKGDTAIFKVTYDGKDVVINMGSGNYYPVEGARESWFPSSSQGLGNYANYQMEFHVPKGLQLIATGTKTGDSNDGKYAISDWKTEAPLPVVGFSMGEFATKQSKFGDPASGQVIVDAYVNQEKPDSLLHAGGGALGEFNTLPMLGDALNQGTLAAQVYTTYFGQLPFSHISLTQQSACNFGQSWPMLVYLPICGFFNTTQQHFLGIGDSDSSDHWYWKTVMPHEVAHQWWGQTVGFHSYRDQWMSEGFANASASIFLQSAHPNTDDFVQYWKDQLRLLTEKNQIGVRPIDIGPVTMGFRLNSHKSGWDIYENLVYPKGAYILHMIRMMMWSPKDRDARFEATMQDFVSTYKFQAATTEDFKAIVEKHMSPGMDLEGNHTMDWFFREYVYGTDLPAYHFESDVKPNGDGWTLHLKLTQSGVGDNFVNTVPIYLELANGATARLGSLKIRGSNTVEQNVSLGKLPAAIKTATINHYYDVLCTQY